MRIDLMSRLSGIPRYGSLPFEVGNAFSAMFKRRRISLPDAKAAVEATENLLMVDEEEFGTVAAYVEAFEALVYFPEVTRLSCRQTFRPMTMGTTGRRRRVLRRQG